MSNYFSDETIAAIATSLAGNGGVGIIRISGPKSASIAEKVCIGFSSKTSRYLHRVEVKEPVTGRILDDGLAVFFERGASFTGEEVVELQLHGGRFLLQSILKLILEGGECRMALPGEFSFRAVRNGRLSLNQAEAINQLIQSKSMFEVNAVRNLLSEAKNAEFKNLADRIRNLLAKVELSIDFIDQDVEVISEKEFLSEVEKLQHACETLLLQANMAVKVARGLLVVIAGEPNAGKSTLFNSILSEDRSIVSDMAGTTRDVVTEEVRIGPYFVRFADTAGIRDSSEKIEAVGISKARALFEEAEAIVLLLDSTEKGLAQKADLFRAHAEKLIVALNKTDRLNGQKADFVGNAVELSAITGAGVHQLLSRIKETLDQKYGGQSQFLPTEFQMQMLIECAEALRTVGVTLEKTGLKNPEILSAALQAAAKSLSDLAGETTADTILNKIFSEFCIGK